MVASAKALTTRGDLAIGISNAIADVADGIDPGSVELVSVSTTLATNAVVEGHGSSVLVVLAGFDQAMVERSGISSAFSDVVIETIAGGHNHYGDELQPLDLDQLGAVLNIHGGAVRAVAVASAFAVRNNAHELAAREHITAMTELPTTISSELSASLDAPRRALTAVLNARLLSKIADLIAAVRRSLDQIGVQAPVMIAKGDGSLAVADSLAQRPIETILSGPAASMVGAGVLSGLDDFILSDNTPTAMDREHTLFEASRCVAVTPSDTAPVLVALEATMVVQRGSNTVDIPASDFFVGPEIDILRMTRLGKGDILLGIRVPGTWSGSHQYFEKVADRNTWDFALVNVAMAARMDGGKISDVSMVCGAVQCTPRRLSDVEDLIKGEAPNTELETLVKRVASSGAKALNFNHFKIPLMQNLAARAVRSLA